MPLTIVRDGKAMTVELPVGPRARDADRVAPGPIPVVLRLRPARLLAGDVRVPRRLRPVGDRFSRVLSLIGSPLVTRRGDRPEVPGRGARRGLRADVPAPDRQGLLEPVREGGQGGQRRRRSATSATWSRLLRDSKDKFITISFDDRASETIVFDRKEVLARHRGRSSTTTASASSASDDLPAVWEGKDKSDKADDKSKGGE